MKRLYIETYGCQMNVADTELMLGVLRRDGYVQAERPMAPMSCWSTPARCATTRSSG